VAEVKKLPGIKVVEEENVPETAAVQKTMTGMIAQDGAKLTLADLDGARAAALAQQLGAQLVASDAIMVSPCDVFSPNALGAILDDDGIAGLDCAIVAGGANNQLARPEHGALLAERGILYAPDYVINAGGIISVATEYLARTGGHSGGVAEVNALVAQIPGRLETIWQESAATGISADVVADRMAQKLIGRG
jgi:leucine dehydrogenase